MTEPNEHRTAYHEAGHAVANVVLCRPFRYVTIIPSEDGLLGHVHTGKVLKSLRERFQDRGYGWDTGRERLWVEREIMTYYAGEAAEIVLGNENETLSGGDLGHIAGWVLGGIPGQRERDAFVAWLWERTLNLVKNPLNWVTIEELAEDLLDKKRLSARAVRKLSQEKRVNVRRDPRLRERYDRRLQLNRDEEEALRRKWEEGA